MLKLNWLTTAVMIICSIICFASTASSQIVAPGSQVAGKTISEWTRDWWQWAAPLPSPLWPEYLQDGLNAPASIRQGGPVFFLPDDAGSQITFACFGSPPDCPEGPTTTHDIQVPSDKYLLVPVYAIMGQAENGLDPIAHAASQANGVQSLFFSLDGESIGSEELAANYREPAETFSLSTPSIRDNVFFLDGGENTLASDGYWTMLEPLPPGEHVIEYGGIGANLSGGDPQRVNMRANITSVLPEPSASTLLVCGSLFAAVVRRRRSIS